MTNDKQRKRLVELIRTGINKHESTIENYVFPIWDYLTDYLLANGVIVPPCRVGEVVYVIPSKANRGINIINGFSHLNRVYEQKISKVEIFANNKYLLTTCDGLQSVHCDLYKETWFLSPEEAEKALGGVQG